MRIWQIIFLSTIAFFVKAQELNELQLINSQVWEPFIKTYNGYQTKAFMALHTDDVIRVSRGSKQILVGTDYRKTIFRGNSISRSRNYEREIDLRFLERIVSGDLAYEVGYYKIRSKAPGIDETVSYGFFQVILKKTGGEWKIYVDSDEDVLLSDEEFDAARCLCDY